LGQKEVTFETEKIASYNDDIMIINFCFYKENSSVEEINRDVQKRNHEIEQEEKRKEEKISEQIRAIMQRVGKWVSFSFVVIGKFLYLSQRFFDSKIFFKIIYL
jgi:hypothetical protein